MSKIVLKNDGSIYSDSSLIGKVERSRDTIVISGQYNLKIKRESRGGYKVYENDVEVGSMDNKYTLTFYGSTYQIGLPQARSFISGLSNEIIIYQGSYPNSIAVASLKRTNDGLEVDIDTSYINVDPTLVYLAIFSPFVNTRARPYMQRGRTMGRRMFYLRLIWLLFFLVIILSALPYLIYPYNIIDIAVAALMIFLFFLPYILRRRMEKRY